MCDLVLLYLPIYCKFGYLDVILQSKNLFGDLDILAAFEKLAKIPFKLFLACAECFDIGILGFEYGFDVGKFGFSEIW